MNEGWNRTTGCVLAGSLTVSSVLLIKAGMGAYVLPFHLCGWSALGALTMAFGKSKQWIIDAMWYLGIPGAALAILFPAPAVSENQWIMNMSYYVTHGMIVVIPAGNIRCGLLPQPKRVWRSFFLLQGMGITAALTNAVLGTDFLFLQAPPLGTPLEAVYTLLGNSAYLIILECLGWMMCMIGGGIVQTVRKRCG